MGVSVALAPIDSIRSGSIAQSRHERIAINRRTRRAVRPSKARRWRTAPVCVMVDHHARRSAMGSRFLFAAAAILAASPAAGAVTVLGNSSARLCYEAAEARGAPSSNLVRTCDQAMSEEGLSDYDRVA